MAKINFVLALSNCILDLAAQRATPLAALVDSTQQNQPMSEANRRAEQLVLLVKALQLLSSALALATRQLKSGQLRPSSNVKTGMLLPFLDLMRLQYKKFLLIVKFRIKL